MTNIENKVAFITGGTKGIGYGVAQILMAEGMKVAITSRSQKAADEAAAELNKSGKGEAFGVESDVRNFESQQAAVQKAIEKFGEIDLLFANAGLGHFATIEDMTPEQWSEVIDTNLTGVFYSVKAGLESLKKSKGFIITLSSLAGTNFFAQGSAYNASKFGLTGFSQAIMLDLRQYGIRVSTIMPGSVATHFNGHTPNEDDAWKIQPEDIGEMIASLMKLDARTLPSKIEVRPSMPPSK
ncbi:short-chain alcohol dehydrogenase [Owenweeksia hongkongensis DSM 17368]|uniref:Short-chain alcohol dehydrogenase n=1 Tax=Owenweeksia hongkongensis (strain DSM 17368 / CIP 108786 / JCM 12287 / NRRL B-23963 / UST20020801) TaxID=926562 RepID=G8R7L2_OWEHD|nr:SDR family oxidoreductase [Owenweeksia hongkongensis]AEV32365.1 short-chain alcohol dehydrogenase [Owenweeksia hongkongensis DSM 17368]